VALAVGGMVVLGAAGCGRVAAGTSSLRVGAVYPLSGSQAEGREELNGVRMAADFVNAAGGVRGRKIDIHAEDAPSSNEAAAAVDRAIDGGATILLGTYGSTQSMPASARASARGATYLETGAVADAVTGRGLPGVLRTVATGSTLGRKAAIFTRDYVLPGLGLTPATARTVVLFEGDSYGSAVGYGAIDEAGAAGFNVVDTIKYDLATADYNQLAAQVDADRPDVVLTAEYIQDAVAFRRAALARHMKVRALVGTSASYCHQQFGNELGPDAVGLFASDKPAGSINPAGLLPEARALWQRATTEYTARYGKEMSAAAISGFVGGWVMFHEILPRATTASRADVWKAAMALDLPEGSEINGAGVRFASEGQSDQGQNRRAVSVIWEWVGLRHRAVVYPPAYATAAFQVLPITN
jgi:branched-chain amino acid transport system substrate-binding protein